MRTRIWLALTIAVALATISTRAQTRKTLDIYVVDVEGRQRDAVRRAVRPVGAHRHRQRRRRRRATATAFMAAVKDAGLTQIDHLITTHWHGDHFGAMETVAAKIPIKHFIDHGGTIEAPAAGNAFVREGYPTLYAKAKHTVAKPGDKIPIAGLDWRIVAAAGQHTTSALPGAGKPNPYCADYKPGTPDHDRERAVGRQHHHVRQVPRRASRRPDVEQGIRADVPEQPHRHRRSLHRLAPRAGDLEFAGARARAASARGRHEQRHAQGRPARTR